MAPFAIDWRRLFPGRPACVVRPSSTAEVADVVRLCAEAGIAPETIVGHHTEEFTHQAVAALIATGAADVGMGTRAVAERFALDYRPLGWEVYFLAARAGLGAGRLAAFREDLCDRASRTSGYAPPDEVRG